MLKSAWQLPIIVAALMGAGPANAADIWVAANVHGSVFELVNDQWTELKNGDGIGNGIAVRTLQAGRVRLVRQGQVLALDPGTAILATGGGTGVTVQQYAGTVTLTGSNVARAQLVTPAVVAMISGASLVSRVSGRAATLSVGVGRVVVSARGRHLTLSAGQTISFDSAVPLGSGSAKIPAGGSGAAAGGATSVTTNGATAGAAGAAKLDNGIGNGGVPGNGGLNGNAGGNNGQNGNGNGNSQQ